MKKLIFLLTLCSGSIYGQVGINNPSPDSSTVLDLSGAPNYGFGLLIPEGGTSNITGIVSPADGLLVRDTSSNEIQIRFESLSEWHSINPWRNALGSNIVYTTGNSVGIGTPTPSSSLEVVGDIEASGSLSAASANFTGTVSAGNFSGDGIVPRGAIMMWSGTTPPTGWVLCDGRMYNSNGTVHFCAMPPAPCTPYIRTPDLRGRFIVGYSSGNADYNQPGNYSTIAAYSSTAVIGDRGGEETHLLTANESGIRSHNHSASTSVTVNHGGAHSHTVKKGNGTSGGAFDIGAHDNNGWYAATGNDGAHSHSASATTTVGNVGSSSAISAHENRPPYYTLAFIMKL